MFTSDPGWTLEWHNTEPVVVTTDAGIRSFVEDLKASPGQDIHLSGGARLAQTMVRLGLVDEYRLFATPSTYRARPGTGRSRSRPAGS